MKPLSNKELFWWILGTLFISLVGTAGSGAPWWCFPIFVIVCLLGARETWFATFEDRFWK